MLTYRGIFELDLDNIANKIFHVFNLTDNEGGYKIYLYCIVYAQC